MSSRGANTPRVQATPRESMLAVRFDSAELAPIARVTLVPMPVPRPGDVLLRVRMAGVCATDLELTRGYKPFTGTLGHEFVADVVSLDSALHGRRVVGEINVGCKECVRCVSGMERHCETRSVLGILNRDGCMAEFVCLPEANLSPVPDSVSDVAAVFTEPLAAALEILDQLHIRPMDRVAVVGDGRLGLLIALALQALCCAPTLVGRHARKLAIAAARGVHTVLCAAPGTTTGTTTPTASTAPTPSISIDLERRSFDVVIDATGRGDGLAAALDLVRPRGTLVLKTTTAATQHMDLGRIDLNRVVVDEISVVGSRCGRFEPALRALASSAVDPTLLVDATYSLREAETALAHAARPGVLKVLIDMRSGS